MKFSFFQMAALRTFGKAFITVCIFFVIVYCFYLSSDNDGNVSTSSSSSSTNKHRTVFKLASSMPGTAYVQQLARTIEAALENKTHVKIIECTQDYAAYAISTGMVDAAVLEHDQAVVFFPQLRELTVPFFAVPEWTPADFPARDDGVHIAHVSSPGQYVGWIWTTSRHDRHMHDARVFSGDLSSDVLKNMLLAAAPVDQADVVIGKLPGPDSTLAWRYDASLPLYFKTGAVAVRSRKLAAAVARLFKWRPQIPDRATVDARGSLQNAVNLVEKRTWGRFFQRFKKDFK